MKKLTLCFTLLAATLGLSHSAIAESRSKTSSDFLIAQSTKENQKQEIKTYLRQKLNLKVEKIDAAPMPGFYQVTTNQGLLYISMDKKYMVYGNVYQLGAEVQNLTEKAQRKHRLDKLKAFEKNMIVFPAKKEKHVVTVFTDTSCGYCKKLHKEMDAYNQKGITVRYLAFPRGGSQSNAFETMQQVWCATDTQKALTQAKRGIALASVKMSRRCDLEIQQQYELGLAFGVNGTPAIILENGDMLPGYVPADKLVSRLSKK